MGVVAPAEIVWSEDLGVQLFIKVYDWDQMLINSSTGVTLSWHVNLCTGFYPCALTIRAEEGGGVVRNANGSIACSASYGCTGLQLSSVTVSCDGTVSPGSFLQVDGVDLQLVNCSFSGCISQTDGAVLQAYGNSSVTINETTFQDVGSLGSGGAISAVGGVLQITMSSFVSCWSSMGGGAVSATTFLCPGSNQAVGTTLYSYRSAFDNCVSQGEGGAILVSGATVNAMLFATSLTGCESSLAGGALSAQAGASVVVVDSVFVNNTSKGLGGGALYIDGAELTLQGLTAVGNRAMAGGGGMLYWSGGEEPSLVPWCDAGSIAATGQKCALCTAGTFQTGYGATVCSFCGPGTFATGKGAAASDSCISCAAGKYSTAAGSSLASSCSLCGIGTFSHSAASACSQCPAGAYSSKVGAANSSECSSCKAGTYSTTLGAADSALCTLCEPGTYSAAQAIECSACRAGTYSTSFGGTSFATCRNCPAGKFSNVTGAASPLSCTLCGFGTYSVNKSFSYYMTALTWEQAEAACVQGGGHLASIESEIENLQVLSMVTAFHDYWIGYRFDAASTAWAWSDGSPPTFVNWGDANPKNGSVQYDCVDYPSYAYTNVNTSGLLAFWPYFSEEFGIFPGAGPYAASAGTWYNYDCNNGMGWVVGYVCSYAGSTSCLSCGSGTYSTLRGATTLESCVPCNVANNSTNSECAFFSTRNGAAEDRDAIDLRIRNSSDLLDRSDLLELARYVEQEQIFTS